MSMNKNYYAIVGCDLTGFVTDKYEEWQSTEDGEKYTCYQSEGNIQLFDDPMSGNHSYFGYVLTTGDEYEFTTAKLGIDDIVNVRGDVANALAHLIEIGVVELEPDFNPDYQVIIFEECR